MHYFNGNKFLFTFEREREREREYKRLKLLNFSRDGNLYPTRGYLARPDPNGSDFTQPDKL